MSEGEAAFSKFAVYSDASASDHEMMCEDSGVMDGKAVTSTDLELIVKVKANSVHTITFAEFQQAMQKLYGKHLEGKWPKEALQAVYGLMEGKKPGSAGTTESQ